jgi:glycosyltransferase involved in cell wall biosynthesis
MYKAIKYISWHEASGYGHAARAYMLGLHRAGVPLVWQPITGGHGSGPYYQAFDGRAVGDPELDPFCNLPLEYDTVVMHLVPEYIPIWRQKEAGKRLIGYCVWETDKLPRHWPALLNQLDGVAVPTDWNRQVFTSSGVRVPIAVIPHILRPLGTAENEWNPALSPDDFIFYTIGDWTARKSVWFTLRAFLQTFTANESVSLVVKTSARDFTRTRRRFRPWAEPGTASAVTALMRAFPHPARIVLIDRFISRPALAALHQRGDCYVSLCRSEGWGLPAFDAAGMGKPVIMTGFGGQLVFLSPDDAFLVDYTLVPVQDPNGYPSYSPDQCWAEPSVTHAAGLLRRVYENRPEARQKGARLAAYAAAHFNEQVVTSKWLEILN